MKDEMNVYILSRCWHVMAWLNATWIQQLKWYIIWYRESGEQLHSQNCTIVTFSGLENSDWFVTIRYNQVHFAFPHKRWFTKRHQGCCEKLVFGVKSRSVIVRQWVLYAKIAACRSGNMCAKKIGAVPKLTSDPMMEYYVL